MFIREIGCCCLLFFAGLLPAQYSKSQESLEADLHHAHSPTQRLNALLGLEMYYRHDQNSSKRAEVLKQIVDFWSAEVKGKSVGVARYSAELGQVLEHTGDFAGAEQYLRSAIEIYDRQGPLYANASVAAKYSLAGALRGEGKSQEADALRASLPPWPVWPKADQPPTLVFKGGEAEYTDDARNHHVSGSVRVSLVIDENGRVTDVEVTGPLGFGLDENAIKTVKRWKFYPAIRNGVPASARAMAEVNFSLL